ncbi:MAG: exonuclease domain-containing protein [Sphaerochaeta sp.]|uniref:exonuclease domain-containing protein n=1 Tax=Sphaerochaeta sp. TaxID=1972642 RepID=UPI001E0DEEB5|nr:exonuclease domain-containing protein [uncultured Sphaerochaeta sp.]MDD3057736.1 exonuclease domain-containing protein [Sphaerochaeta sp.]MDD3929366.1 exonuclease domain-containing protein [Sphaerochaeta sp.]NCC13368.1 DNA polymerase III [Spirochaetia bacterium]NCC91361.1 DNA polymerase III [Spirochaetia bacterium]
MNYVALDFETANSYPGGACSVALARFDEEGTLLDTYYTLIHPKQPYFDPGMTAVHQLKDEECLAAPEFDAIWPDMRTFIGRDLLVAHNAVFDMGVLKGCFEAYDLEARQMSYLCTLVISRKVWPKMLSYKLSYLVDYFGMEYQAHYALDDAIMCGKIMHKLCYGHLNEMLDLRRFLITKGIEPKFIENQRKDADFFL